MIIKRGEVKVLSIIDTEYDTKKEKEIRASMERASEQIKTSEKKQEKK
jgi:hypothetical protein